MSFLDDVRDKPPTTHCDRCGDPKPCERFDRVILCDDCLVLIQREWRIRKSEVGVLSK